MYVQAYNKNCNKDIICKQIENKAIILNTIKEIIKPKQTHIQVGPKGVHQRKELGGKKHGMKISEKNEVGEEDYEYQEDKMKWWLNVWKQLKDKIDDNEQ